MRPLETSVTQVLRFGHDADLRRRFMEVSEAVPGNLRFGLTLEVLDKLAEETALAYVRRTRPAARVVTAAIDGIRVRSPADVTRDLLFLARVNHVGRSSMEVGIRVEQDADPPRHIASCYFTMVARDGDSSVPVPALTYADDLERDRRFRAVARREAVHGRDRAAEEPPTREEFDLLLRLRREREAAGSDAKLTRDLVTTAWERVYPEHENVPTKIFGGYLIHRAYQLAAIHAGQLCDHRAVVAAVNRINFLRPVRIGDTLRYVSRIVYTGRTSVAVEIKIERIGQGETELNVSNECVFTFVNVDHDLRPRPVPRVYPTTYRDDERYLRAYRTHQAHMLSKRGLMAASAL